MVVLPVAEVQEDQDPLALEKPLEDPDIKLEVDVEELPPPQKE